MLTYTTFTLPSYGDVIYTPNWCAIYVANSTPGSPFFWIAYDFTTATWQTQPGSTAIVSISTATLALLPTLFQPASVDIQLAQLIDANPVTIVGNTATPTGFTSHYLDDQTIPPQPPPQPGWNRRTIDLDFRRRRPARRIQP